MLTRALLITALPFFIVVRNGYVAGVDFSAAVMDLDDPDALAAAAIKGRFTAIVCNPPQMPGPPELASTR